jgi:hypothetical protein
MGWMSDLAILGALGIGGWWFLNNYKSIGGGGGGSTEGSIPPLEGAPAPAATLPGTDIPAMTADGRFAVDPRQDIRKLFETQHGLSSTKECASAPTTTAFTARKCVKAGAHTTVIFDHENGLKCISSTCGNGKVKGCKCTYPESAVSAFASYATSVEYAHNIPRTRLRRLTAATTIDSSQ